MVEYDVHGSTQEILKIVHVFEVIIKISVNKKLIAHVAFSILAICLKRMYF